MKWHFLGWGSESKKLENGRYVYVDGNLQA